MWLKFDLKINDQWDKINLNICFLWEKSWKSILLLEWDKICDLTEQIAKNILGILNTEQIFDNYDIERTPKFWFKWLFSDCHSFALSLAIWASSIWNWPLWEDFLTKVSLRKVWLLKIWDKLPKLQQWDLITTEWLLHWNHSMVYLCKKRGLDFFIHCVGCLWYVDFEWKCYSSFYKKIFDEITFDFNWQRYVKEWYRVWWWLAFGNIQNMYEECEHEWIKKLGIYRKK